MDKRTFGASYLKYSDAIFRHCYFRVYDRELARDLTQQTFTRAWEYLSKGKIIKNMRAFLYQTARNLVVDYFRSKRSISLDTLLEKGFEPSGNAGRDPEKQLESREVQFLLLKLRAADREVIVMRYIDGLKPREIASITKENTNVVSVRLYRASRAFRKVCEEHGYDS
ncbi:MAG: ECF subfamily RNA polymerase sigma-70 factor [Candidatus Pacebacteria bacterium GW2011_GWB1_47_8]|nr:MAG: ECF subfamily RNA polymerase sigma-70 factor [Candidatus Pacebacteria bacterium GW2011_GWA1_46_10]KKU84231.1 MAG: ECF subfamily RNA polymerase sigma-70 factor [Candidatus Pacebacteria bacterium GW2011_GWB1_47_8]HCR81451.1 hypothetical protein [Candidatus Paceibacterota bacterium]